MNKKAIELVVDLLVDKYSQRFDSVVEDAKGPIPHSEVSAAITPLLDMMAVKTAIKEDNYDPIWHAVVSAGRPNKKHKKKLKKLRHILDKE